MNKPAKQSVAQFITYSIHVSGKLQKDIAREIGYDRPNMITMLKQGLTALPLDKVGPLAKSLEVDPLYLFKLVMAEYYPETFEALKDFMQGLHLSEEELAILSLYRKLTEEESDSKQLVGVVMTRR